MSNLSKMKRHDDMMYAHHIAGTGHMSVEILKMQLHIAEQRRRDTRREEYAGRDRRGDQQLPVLHLSRETFKELAKKADALGVDLKQWCRDRQIAFFRGMSLTAYQRDELESVFEAPMEALVGFLLPPDATHLTGAHVRNEEQVWRAGTEYFQNLHDSIHETLQMIAEYKPFALDTRPCALEEIRVDHDFFTLTIGRMNDEGAPVFVYIGEHDLQWKVGRISRPAYYDRQWDLLPRRQVRAIELGMIGMALHVHNPKEYAK